MHGYVKKKEDISATHFFAEIVHYIIRFCTELQLYLTKYLWTRTTCCQVIPIIVCPLYVKILHRWRRLLATKVLDMKHSHCNWNCTHGMYVCVSVCV